MPDTLELDTAVVGERTVWRLMLRSIVLMVFTAAAIASAGAQTPDKTRHMIEGVRNVRYCEIIPVVRRGFHLRATVYNTLGLNDCPAAVWDKITEAAMKKRFGALQVVLNGPRHFVMDAIAAEGDTASGATIDAGGLALTARATIKVGLSDLTDTSQIPLDYRPPPLGKCADIVAKISALYPEADFSDPSWGTLRLPEVSIEFSLGKDEEIDHFAMHVRGGDPAPHIVAHILGELGMRAVCSGSESGLFDYDPVSGSKAFDSWRGYGSYVSSRINGAG